MTRSLQFWTKVFQYIKAHPQDRVGLAAYTDKLAAVEGDVQHGMSRILNGVMAPVFSQAIMAAIKGEADFRCHRALAFAMEYRAMYRTLPKSLNEAGFDLDDPFNGKPLHYKPGNGSLRVWSVGPDLKDDGGMARTGAFVNFDVVASYPPTILKR